MATHRHTRARPRLKSDSADATARTAPDPGEHNRNGAREVTALAAAVRSMIGARNDGEADAILREMPLAGVFFFALMGPPGERAEINPPLILTLRAIRATVHGWACARSGSTLYAAVPFADLDLLACRVDATIEIARRGAVAGGAP